MMTVERSGLEARIDDQLKEGQRDGNLNELAKLIRAALVSDHLFIRSSSGGVTRAGLYEQR